MKLCSLTPSTLRALDDCIAPKDYSIRELSRYAGPVFAFFDCKVGFEPTKICFTYRLATNASFANSLRCAGPVASHLVRNEIQHTAYLLPCGLLNVVSSFTCPMITGPINFGNANRSSTRMVELIHYPLTISFGWVCVFMVHLPMIIPSLLAKELSFDHKPHRTTYRPN